MSARSLFAGIVAVFTVIAGSGHATRAEPLRIFHFTWIGYGPLFVAKEKGFFAKEGVEVSLIRNDDHTAAFAGLAAAQVDAVAGGLQDVVLFSEFDEGPLLCVLVTNDTRGADGVVADRDIESIAGLKGQTVAVPFKSTSQFYLNALLREAGLSEADLAAMFDVDADEAAELFLLQEVDVAVTYEPWLTEAKKAGHGHLLTDTSEQPGLLVDCVLTTPDILSEREVDFEAFSRAWDAAVDYLRAHPDEAYEIIADGFEGWLDDPAVVAESVSGIHYYDGEENRAYFGTPEQPGQIYDTVQRIIDVWSSFGRVKADISPADVVAHDVWSQ